MKSVLTGLQTAGVRNPGFRTVSFQRNAYRAMGGLVAAAVVTGLVTVSFSKAQAAIAPLPTPILLAQMNAADGPAAAAPDSGEDIPYRVLLGVALVFAVVSGVVYLRSDS